MLVVDHHPDYPPKIGQFRKIIKGLRTAEQYESRPICPVCRSYSDTPYTAVHKEKCL